MTAEIEGPGMNERDELKILISAITEYSVPKKIVLFGSRAQGRAICCFSAISLADVMYSRCMKYVN